jgi:hypothetical protein
MTINSNLPIERESTDSSDAARKFFNGYYENSISISSNALDSVVGFFTSRGFEGTSATAVGTVLLTQARRENINVFQLIDTLTGLNELQLSRVVTEILNFNRLKISSLGFRVDNSELVKFEKRNLII